MATYNLDQYPASVLLEVSKTRSALRWERHYNILAIPGLAVGDIVSVTIPINEWVRTIYIGKRSDTSNADVIAAVCNDPGLTLPIVYPLKTATTVQTAGSSSNAAASTILMPLAPLGNSITVSWTVVASVPTKGVLSVAFYDF